MNLSDLPPLNVIASGVDFETFLQRYMDQSVEWLKGEVIKKMAESGSHNEIIGFLHTLFSYYLSKTNEGKVRFEKFTMRLSPDYAPEPDLLVVIAEHLERLHETFLDGAADLVVEIVSKSSSWYDRGFKFDAYETAGVREYWIIDPLRRESLFYVLDEQGVYQAVSPDVNGIYHSRVLPRLRLSARLLHQEPVPTAVEAVAMVEAMLH